MHMIIHKLMTGLLLCVFCLLNLAALTRTDLIKTDIQETLGFVPDFMKLLPEPALEGSWTQLKGLMLNDSTALGAKAKELTALAVSAQIPCDYCIYAHTEFARLNGASNAEIGDALGIAAQARYWSSIFHGVQLDENQYKAEIKRFVTQAKKATKNPPALEAIRVTDADSALKDIKQSLGFVPSFFQKLPKDVLPGAWIHMRDVELNPDGALSAKEKSLIGLAVSSQIPCRYCVYSDSEFAKLNGASEEELQETVAVASVVRLMSSYLNGLQVNEKVFREDIDTIVKNTKAKRAALPTASR